MRPHFEIWRTDRWRSPAIIIGGLESCMRTMLVELYPRFGACAQRRMRATSTMDTP
jgi:hypothetical protein